MNRNALYLIIGILIVAGAGDGLSIVQRTAKDRSIVIDVGKNGISIEKK